MIICEAFTYRDGPSVYEFRDASGDTPICRLRMVAEHWELTFFRGPAYRGPYCYPTEESARKHLRRYLAKHGEKLVGTTRSHRSAAESAYDRVPKTGCDAMGRPFADVKVTPRRPRRRW